MPSSPLRVGGRYALIGLGEIGACVADCLARTEDGPELVGALVRRHDPRLGKNGSPPLVTRLEEILERRPDVVVETAGHAAVYEYACAVLEAGCDLIVISTGPLADDEFRATLLLAAARGGARVIVPAGAIGGLDALSALARSGLSFVTYTSVKPATAWLGTPAANCFDLQHLERSVEIFRGSAREAALAYPRNANLAATIALAGIGLDQTNVVLVADPLREDNMGSIMASGSNGSLMVSLTGPAMEGNPKSSRLTAFSIVCTLENRWKTLVI